MFLPESPQTNTNSLKNPFLLSQQNALVANGSRTPNSTFNNGKETNSFLSLHVALSYFHCIR